jgi:hypothetical protein
MSISKKQFSVGFPELSPLAPSREQGLLQNIGIFIAVLVQSGALGVDTDFRVYQPCVEKFLCGS